MLHECVLIGCSIEIVYRATKACVDRTTKACIDRM